MALTADTLLRYDRPGPRYTSYPTVPAWSEAGPELLREALPALTGPVSVYGHVPFCADQCLYCGCNMVVARRQSAGDRFLDALQAQVDALPLPADAVPVVRLHLGGGTPTWLDESQLDRLFTLLTARFPLAADGVASLEADPEVTHAGHLAVMARHGVRRLSLGVQDLDPAVLAAVQRPQGFDRLAGLVSDARAAGIERLNFDLMYGLPYQTVATVEATLERLLSLRPDRLALFGYAHVPWLKPHQAKLPEAALPGALDRAELFLRARELLLGAGYVAIGLDHFALPDDPLAVARREGRLWRDFMGYTTRPFGSLVGLGPSAISELPDRYAQQESHLGRWLASAALPPVVKGYRLSDDDRLRRDVIQAIMCNHEVRWDAVDARHGTHAHDQLQAAVASLRPLEVDGLVEQDASGLRVTDDGALLVRNVAMAFDAYLGAGRFSRTV